MHAIPEKLNALRQQMESTMINRLHTQREELEKKMADTTSTAEENAVQRADRHLQPLLDEMEKRLQARLDKVQLTADQALPRIAEVLERYEALKNEVAPLHSRADAAAARLDRLGVQSATTSKDCTTLNQDFRDAVVELRAILADQEKKRGETEQALRVLIQEKSATLAANTQTVLEHAEDQHRKQMSNLDATEQRLCRNMKELEERTRREANVGNEGVVSKLMPEIHNVEALVNKKSEDCNAKAEALICASMTKLREELDAAAKRCISSSDQQVDRKSRELSLAMENGLAQANRLTESVREQQEAALRDQAVSIRGWASDSLADAASNLENLRLQVVSVEQRCLQAAELAQNGAVETAGHTLEIAINALRHDMQENMKTNRKDDEKLRADLEKLVETEATRLESVVGEMGSKCTATAEANLNLAGAHFHEKLTAVAKEAHERTDAAQVAAADALKKEAQARQAAFVGSDAAKETLAKNIREELRSASNDAESRLRAAATAADERIDQANAAIKSLEHSLQAHAKEHTDTTASLRNQLKSERQMTEEHEANTEKKLQSVRDSFENRLTLEANDIRKSLGDCRKRIHDEVTDIRAEMREKADKKEVAEVHKTTSSRCEEVSQATEGHRTRLEAAVNDFSNRYRETRHEANESRLRTQREAIQLGSEITQLRAACTSLATGVVKALTVLGLLNSEGRDGGAPPAPDKPKGVEVEDLLQWEKAGRSLALRVERQWHKQEAAGHESLLALLERNIQDTISLQHVLGQDGSTSPRLRALTPAIGSPPPKHASPQLNSTTSTMPPASAGSTLTEAVQFTPCPPKPSTAPAGAPQAVREARERRLG